MVRNQNEMKRFYTRKQIEENAEKMLIEYQHFFGQLTEPPVPIDDLIEQVFDLKISWEPIKCGEDERIFGSLRPDTRQIVLNENELTFFANKPGVERSTKGHELGHWDLFLDHSKLSHPLLPGFNATEHFIQRSALNGKVDVIRSLAINPALYAKYKQMQLGKDTPLVKSSVDYYSSVISMPRFLVMPIMKLFLEDWDNWSRKPFNYILKDLYDIANLFEVTITALNVRLEQLRLIYIPPDEKSIYRNRQEFEGQLTLW